MKLLKYLKHTLPTCMYMQHPDLLLQHLYENTYNIRPIQMKHLEHTLQTYVHSYCNICNISFYFCNTDTKYLQHTSETPETYVWTCAFTATSPCCLGMEARCRVEFTGVDLTTPVVKAASGRAPVEKADCTLEKAARQSGVRGGDGARYVGGRGARDGGAAWRGMGACAGDGGSGWQQGRVAWAGAS